MTEPAPTGSGGSVSGSGGSPGTGGSGASGSDASTDAVPAGDGGACPGLFCEDFEQGQIDPAIWVVQTGAGGTATVVQDTVGHGKHALHIHGTGAGGDFALIVAKNMPKALQGVGPIFGRIYLYAMSTSMAHIELGFAGTTHDPAVPATIAPRMNFNYMEFAEYAGSWQLGFDLFAPDPAIAKGFVEEASYPAMKDRLPVAKWSCIEWEFNDDPETMVLWVDGTQIDQFDVDHISFTTAPRMQGSVLNGKSSGIVGGFTTFGFGIHSYGRSPAGVDRYYDDIVLDTKRIHCLP